MLKTLFIASALLACTQANAGVDVNTASLAQLDGIMGIGPATSAAILEQRKQGEFIDWVDFIRRVPGIGPGNAARLSCAGLTVGNAVYPRSVKPCPVE